MLRNEKIGDSSGGVSPACCMRGGLREKIIDAGRDPFPSLGPALTGDSSVDGEGGSGGGVCHRGGVSTGVPLAGVTLLEDFLLSLLESLFPQLEMNERTNKKC